jgi:CBS domain containing-hemolysin-like protein
MNDVFLLLLVIALMLLGSFVCSGVEAALLTVSPVKVHELARRERPVPGRDGWSCCASAWGAPWRCW